MRPKKILTVLLTAALAISMFTACGGSSSSEKKDEDSSKTEEETDTKARDLTTYYDKDEAINLFINNFNSVNSDQITSDMAQPYSHHGSEHEDQIHYFTDDDFEITLSGGSTNSFSVMIGLVHYDEPKTDDEFKQKFFEYARGFDPSFSDSTLDGYWDSVLNHTGDSDDSSELLLVIQKYDNIEYLTIDGKVKE